MTEQTMRIALLALLVAPLVALAQRDANVERARDVQLPSTPEGAGEEEEAEAPPGETEGVEVLQEGDQVKLTEGARTSAPGEVHTVATGDTLWDLSQRFLGSPWYWPKVWSYNPEIANPHWIYPGNLVRFFPGGEETPTRVEVGEGPEETVEPGEMIPSETELLQVAGQIGYVAKRSILYHQMGFVTARQLDEAGTIHSSFSETQMLSYPYTVYISFKKKGDAKVGDTNLVFRSEGEVEHPVTGFTVGYMTRLLGTVKVTAVSNKLVTAEIRETWDEIRRGDLIGPAGEQVRRSVALRPNERQLKGYVVTAMVPHIGVMGEHQVIIVDRGGADGVQPGNTFTVIRQNDGLRGFFDPTETDLDLPVEDVATCMAVDVKDKATVCLLTRSLREVVKGDRVVMRPGGGASPASMR
ncbi:MAG: LysM peptidoglycan-binding domain-containing protein [Myxococcales bacterium]|nr:LysM peptidoglycan-binding domain-containing protein [Myxococcales bacterium]